MAQSTRAEVPAGVDLIDVSLYEQDTWRGAYADLRKNSPVCYQSDSAVGPFWSVMTHDLIKQVDTNQADYSSAKGISVVDEGNLPDGQGTKNFIAMDPPEHDEQRKVVAPSVAPSNLKNFEPIIRERAANILDNLPVGETFNWVQHVSIELTSSMLATLFDFPLEDRHKLVHWSDVATNSPVISGEDNTPEALQALYAELMECAGAFYELWAERAAQPPKFDLISMLAHGETTRNMNENPQLFLGNILLLLIGGNDTTRNSISGGVLALNQYPDEYAKLRANLNLIPNMVAEMVRWQTPVLHMRRTTTRDVTLGGQHISEGEKVVMWYLSGNRDEAVFEAADEFRIERPNARAHVAFGFGIHRCMGNRLAELQLRVLWEEISKRFSHVEQVGDVVRLPNNLIRGVRDLPVRVHPL